VNDEEFLERFENASLPPDGFRHADHVRMAFLYLRKYPAVEALWHFSAALARFAAAQGKGERYHETITWAYLLIIRERMARDERRWSWSEFAGANPDLLNWEDSVLKKYYREETLASDLARRTFLLPDRYVDSRQ
jgi:hypothetical protein